MRKAAFTECTAAAVGPKAAFTECTSAAPNPPDVYEARASISGIATRRCLARVEVRAAKLVSRGRPTGPDCTAPTPIKRLRAVSDRDAFRASHGVGRFPTVARCSVGKGPAPCGVRKAPQQGAR